MHTDCKPQLIDMKFDNVWLTACRKFYMTTDVYIRNCICRRGSLERRWTATNFDII